MNIAIKDNLENKASKASDGGGEGSLKKKKHPFDNPFDKPW